MQERLLLGHPQLGITLARLCQQLIEKHDDFQDTVLLGLQPRGVFLAERIKSRLKELNNVDVPLGLLDATFFRDDFRRRNSPARANATKIDFLLENKKVVLIDDVFYTGRSVRAALDAMTAFGRPQKVELLALVVRNYAKHVPITPDFVGHEVNTLDTQKVQVEWVEQDGVEQDNVWLVNKED